MAAIPNPHNDFIPTVGQLAKVVGACHPKMVGKVVTVTAVYESDGLMWYECRYHNDKLGEVYGGGVLGGLESFSGN